MSAFRIRRKFPLLAIMMTAMLLSPTIARASSDQDLPGTALPVKKKEVAGPAVPASLKKHAPQEKQNREEKIKKDAAPAKSWPTQESTTEPTPETDVTKAAPESASLEGAGLYEKPTDGSLGANVWEGSTRSAITDLIESMPVSSRQPAVQKMIFGALLTKADLTKITEDKPATPGHDLLTLRMDKLIEAGAYKQALELYTSLGDETPPEGVARNGVLAMLFTGQKSLACLELNTVTGNYPGSDFFKNIAAYCDATLSDKASDASLNVLKESKDKLLLTLATQKDFVFTYQSAAFDKFSTLEKALLTAEKKISLPSGDRDFMNVPASHIQILMNASNLTAEDKYILDIRALDWGLMKSDDLEKIYKEALSPDMRVDPALAVPAGKADWEKLPYFLQLAKNKKTDDEKWSFIRAALPIGKKYGVSALLPFSDIIYALTPKDPTFEEIKASILILNHAGLTIPSQWIDIIKKYSPSADQKVAYNALLAGAWLSETAGQRDPAIKEKLLKDLEGKTDLSTALEKYIIENLDKDKNDTHNAIEIYENKKDLTVFKDYVMPSKVLWNRLLEAGQKGRIGETVLSGATALNVTALSKIYPGLFVDTLQSLKNVGLTNISDNLAISAVFGNIDL